VTPELVERYARAIERADVEALTAQVGEDVVLEMPPLPTWSHGRHPYRQFMQHLFAWRGTHGRPAWSAPTASPCSCATHSHPRDRLRTSSSASTQTVL
jgi:hypothetical protein